VKLKVHQSKVDLTPENPVALIMGDGRTLKSDLETFLKTAQPHDVISINRSFHAYPGNIRHWAKVDGPEYVYMAEHLPLINNGAMPIRHTLGEVRGFDVDWDDGREYAKRWDGSSSLFAAMIAVAMGYEKVILAGCPMDLNGHWYFEGETGPDWEEEDYQAWREFAKTEDARKVESLSGFTKEVLQDQ
jgi:hypothetical protein